MLSSGYIPRKELRGVIMPHHKSPLIPLPLKQQPCQIHTVHGMTKRGWTLIYVELYQEPPRDCRFLHAVKGHGTEKDIPSLQKPTP